jgi:hypothetical protein
MPPIFRHGSVGLVLCPAAKQHRVTPLPLQNKENKLFLAGITYPLFLKSNTWIDTC